MSVLKMEYITVLQNPETHVNIGELVNTGTKERRFSNMLCFNCDKRNILIGVLLLFTLISLLTQLPLHLQSQRQSVQIKKQEQKLSDLLLAKEILLQEFVGKKNGASKTRHTRTATTRVPHFYVEGWKRNNGDIDATNEHGIFRWKAPTSRSFNRENDDFHADVTFGSLTKVQITKTGVYFVFAKVTANGRNPHESNVVPPVGIRLMRNEEILDVAWKTQDERGKKYSPLRYLREESNQFPIDTLTIFGLHYLVVNDNIYIQRPPDRPFNEPDRFLPGGKRQQFGMFLVESCINC